MIPGWPGACWGKWQVVPQWQRTERVRALLNPRESGPSLREDVIGPLEALG